MPDLADVNAELYIVLMRARRAWEKAERMHEAGYTAECDRLTAKAKELRKDADAMDPEHRCPAWVDHSRGTA